MTTARLKELERRAKSLVGNCAITQIGISGFWFQPGDRVSPIFKEWIEATVRANRENEEKEASVRKGA